MKRHMDVHIRRYWRLVGLRRRTGRHRREHLPTSYFLPGPVSGDPKATIKSYNFGWKAQEHFYFRVQFQNAADLATFTKAPWSYSVPYTDDHTKKTIDWNDSVVTYMDANKFWATIRVTAKSPNNDVRPSPQQKPGGADQ